MLYLPLLIEFNFGIARGGDRSRVQTQGTTKFEAPRLSHKNRRTNHYGYESAGLRRTHATRPDTARAIGPALVQPSAQRGSVRDRVELESAFVRFHQIFSTSARSRVVEMMASMSRFPCFMSEIAAPTRMVSTRSAGCSNSADRVGGAVADQNTASTMPNVTAAAHHKNSEIPRAQTCLSSLQLGVLLHQLLQAEARKLYRNLGFFAFSFALIDGAFAIFRMADLLAGAESALAGGLFDGSFGTVNFLPRLAKNSAMFSMEL